MILDRKEAENELRVLQRRFADALAVELVITHDDGEQIKRSTLNLPRSLEAGEYTATVYAEGPEGEGLVEVSRFRFVIRDNPSAGSAVPVQPPQPPVQDIQSLVAEMFRQHNESLNTVLTANRELTDKLSKAYEDAKQAEVQLYRENHKTLTAAFSEMASGFKEQVANYRLAMPEPGQLEYESDARASERWASLGEKAVEALPVLLERFAQLMAMRSGGGGSGF